MAQSIIKAHEGWARFIKQYGKSKPTAGYGNWTIADSGKTLVLIIPTGVYIGNLFNYQCNNNTPPLIDYLSAQLANSSGGFNLFQVFHYGEENGDKYVTFGDTQYKGKNENLKQIAELNGENIIVQPQQIFSNLQPSSGNIYEEKSYYTNNNNNKYPFYPYFAGLYSNGIFRLQLRCYNTETPSDPDNCEVLSSHYPFMTIGAYGHLWYSLNLNISNISSLFEINQST